MANFCPQCGSPTDPTKKFCENCGTNLMLFSEPTTEQPVQPAAAPDAALNEGYVVPETAQTPSYPQQPQNTAPQNTGYTIPNPSAPQNTSAPDSGYTIPNPSALQNPYAQNTGSAPAVTNASQFIQPTQGMMQNGESSVIPPAGETRKSGKSLLPVIIALAAILLIALFFLLRKPRTPEPEPVIAAPEPTPFVISTPDIQIPDITAEPAHTDVPQGLNSGAGFEKYSIPCNMEINREYNYPGVYVDNDETAYGTLTFLQYDTNPVDDSVIEFGKENDMDLEGYRIHKLYSQIDFTGPDALERDISVTRYTSDYYDIDLVDNTFETLTDSYGDTYYRYEVEFNGEHRYIYVYVEDGWKNYDNYLEYAETATFLIPDGYDGAVRGFVNPKLDDVTQSNNPDDFYLFRLKN